MSTDRIAVLFNQAICRACDLPMLCDCVDHLEAENDQLHRENEGLDITVKACFGENELLRAEIDALASRAELPADDHDVGVLVVKAYREGGWHMLQWTAKKPEEPGWYFILSYQEESNDVKGLEVVPWTGEEWLNGGEYDERTYYAGPIPEPLPPKTP